jgi:hypothetical protein
MRQKSRSLFRSLGFGALSCAAAVGAAALLAPSPAQAGNFGAVVVIGNPAPYAYRPVYRPPVYGGYYPYLPVPVVRHVVRHPVRYHGGWCAQHARYYDDHRHHRGHGRGHGYRGRW